MKTTDGYTLNQWLDQQFPGNLAALCVEATSNVTDEVLAEESYIFSEVELAGYTGDEWPPPQFRDAMIRVDLWAELIDKGVI